MFGNFNFINFNLILLFISRNRNFPLILEVRHFSLTFDKIPRLYPEFHDFSDLSQLYF